MSVHQPNKYRSCCFSYHISKKDATVNSYGFFLLFRILGEARRLWKSLEVFRSKHIKGSKERFLLGHKHTICNLEVLSRVVSRQEVIRRSVKHGQIQLHKPSSGNPSKHVGVASCLSDRTSVSWRGFLSPVHTLISPPSPFRSLPVSQTFFQREREREREREQHLQTFLYYTDPLSSVARGSSRINVKTSFLDTATTGHFDNYSCPLHRFVILWIKKKKNSNPASMWSDFCEIKPVDDSYFPSFLSFSCRAFLSVWHMKIKEFAWVKL